MMFSFWKRKAWLPPCNTGPSSFADWAEEDIDRVSKAIRSHGQPESDGFRRFARVALNTLRGGSTVELVVRAMEESVKRKHAKAKTAARSKRSSAFNGVLSLGPKALARFEECMTNPGEPTPANKRGAAMLRKLYSKSR